jgi:quaternary ammonium compound-resistance protein SugE
MMVMRPNRLPGRAAPYPDSDKTASGEPMYWIALVVSGVLEAVWATALGKSEGLSRLTPSLVFAAASLASFAGLAYAMKGLPIGTAYAVWVGIGAALTAGYAMWSGDEPASLVRVLLLVGIVGCVIGLKATH